MFVQRDRDTVIDTGIDTKLQMDDQFCVERGTELTQLQKFTVSVSACEENEI